MKYFKWFLFVAIHALGAFLLCEGGKSNNVPVAIAGTIILVGRLFNGLIREVG